MGDLLPTDDGTTVNLDEFNNEKFDFTPDNSQGKLVITIHGPKNAGKSTSVFLITSGRLGGFRRGKTLAISFDDKTKTTREQFFKFEEIIVHDGTKYYTEDPMQKTKSGYLSYRYLQELLKREAKNNNDWIFFDGLTVESEILEMAMRYLHGLKPTQGFANFNLWKDRGSMLRTLHNLAVRAANIGVIYSTYSEKDEIVKDGQIVTKEDIPRYIDVIMMKTDVVLKATKAKGKNGNLFYLTVEGTKFKQYFDNGKVLPVTDRTLKEGTIFDVTGMSDQPRPKSAEVEVVSEVLVSTKQKEIEYSKEEKNEIAAQVQHENKSLEKPAEKEPETNIVNKPAVNLLSL